MRRPSADFVLLPKLTEAVVFEPLLEPFGILAVEHRGTVFSIRDDRVFGLEPIEQQRGLRRHDHLCLVGYLPDQGTKKFDRGRMESKFRLVYQDKWGSQFLRLEKQSCKRNESKRSVRERRCVEVSIGVPVTPFEFDVVWPQFERLVENPRRTEQPVGLCVE